jgi:8-oxo-dGTP pyrophosphatase MutT (NUDIX family)
MNFVSLYNFRYILYMGASILPVTIYNNKLYFLFGKERNIDENPGWSDFGGGTDKGESYMTTAIREGMEEMTGFLGTEKDIKQLLQKYGTYQLNYNSNGYSTYRVHIFPMIYEPLLVKYYNNNQKFLQKRLDPKIIKNSKIFEKTEIRWFDANELTKMLPQFRSFYQNVVKMILEDKSNIDIFVRKALQRNRKKTRKTRKRI